MSERSIKRANERRAAKERRRETLRRKRTGLATGAAIGATALFAPSAQAETFTVDVLTDGPADACAPDACTLRDAIDAANGSDPTDTDTILFESGLNGQIVLTEGELGISGPNLTIDGPGRSLLSVSGDADNNGPDDGDFRVFSITADDATIEGLTLTEGRGVGSGGDVGGAVYVGGGAELALTASAVTGSTSTGRGGGIYVRGRLALDDTQVSGNTAHRGGGIAVDDESPGAFVTDSQITGNTATSTGGGISAESPLTVERSTISGNTAGGGGGIYSFGKYGGLDVTDSVIQDNIAEAGGGVFVSGDDAKYGVDRSFDRTTIVGNTATSAGGGVLVLELVSGDDVTISRSTLSGNETDGFGGGIALNIGENEGIAGEVLVSNSTVSGNTADSGGGVSIGGYQGGRVYGAIDFANSTIAANTATTRGGGIYLGAYEVGEEQTTSAIPLLTSTIVADNTVDGVAQDLDQPDDADGGGFDSAFSLVEAPGDAPILQEAGDANILGSDPQLGALGDNEGPTETHVPASTSPAIDKGDAVPRDDTDQRGRQRTQDGTAIANPEGGDGTDIGAVEIERVQAAPQEQPPPQQQPPAQQQQPPPPPPQQQPPQPIIRRFPSGLTLRTTPRSDLTGPWTFRSTGRVIPPAGMTVGEACGSIGVVTIQVKRNGTTISNRPALVQPDCTYSSQVTFRFRQRFGRAKSLKFTARFGGNQLLEPITSRSRFRRVQK